MTDDSLGGGLQRCGHRYCGAKNHFLHFLKTTISEKCQKKKLRGNGERNPHQVARERIFPIWGKCGLQANLALLIPNFSG